MSLLPFDKTIGQHPNDRKIVDLPVTVHVRRFYNITIGTDKYLIIIRILDWGTHDVTLTKKS